MKFKMRKYDHETMAYSESEMTKEEIVSNPVGLHLEDMAMALLNSARVEAGLPLFGESTDDSEHKHQVS